MVPSLIYAARFSAAAVAGTLAGVSAITTVMMLVVGSRILSIPLGRTAKAFAPAFGAGAVMSIALATWQPGNLIVAVIYGATIYAISLQLIDPQIVRWVVDNLLKRRAEPAPAQ